MLIMSLQKILTTSDDCLDNVSESESTAYMFLLLLPFVP